MKPTEASNDDKAIKIVVNDDFIKEYASDERVIGFIKKKIKRINRQGASNLIILLLQNQNTISSDDIMPGHKSLCRYNLAKFNDDRTLKPDYIQELKALMNVYLISIKKDIINFTERDFNFDKHEDDYVLNKNVVFDIVMKLLCDEGKHAKFYYDFDNPDIDTATPHKTDMLQRCNIQILTTPMMVNYPTMYFYHCTVCGTTSRRRAYEVVGLNDQNICPGIYFYETSDGQRKSKRCQTRLKPLNEKSEAISAFYYTVGYEDEDGTYVVAQAISFEKYKPGFCECVFYNTNTSKKTDLLVIMKTKPHADNTFTMPGKVPMENYIITLQKAFDAYIYQQTGLQIYGLDPIKYALIIQKACNAIGYRLRLNTQLVGDASTGKSMILKYYGFLLNDYTHLSTNGLSISIPGLRGTRESVLVLGKENKIVTLGALGEYNTIHIDEAGENKELIQNLKVFLMEDNYSYNKAGGTGAFHKRRSHINISENIDITHIGQYRGMIRKKYKDDNIRINEEDKIEWSEDWDLHMPLDYYDNIYLRKAVKDVRMQYTLNKQWWIDGYDYALHERFPFYFYLVSNKMNDELSRVIGENASANIISDNFNLMKVLKTAEIGGFFDSLKERDIKASDKFDFMCVNKIFDEYDLNLDARMRELYYDMIKISCIINGRKQLNEEDYNMLRYILETTNRKIDVIDTANYMIRGPVDIEKEKMVDFKIADGTREVEKTFGIPGGDFNAV